MRLCVVLAVVLAACRPPRPPVVLRAPDGTPATEHLAPAETAPEVLRQRAKEADQGKDSQAALAAYERLLYYHPDESDQVRRRYAELLALAGRAADAAAELEAVGRPGVRTDVEALLAAHLAAGNGLRAAQLAMGVGDHARVLSIVERSLSSADADALWTEVHSDPAWGFAAPLLALRLAKARYHGRDYEGSQKLLALFGTRFAESPHAKAAGVLLRRLQARTEVRVDSIGVILPLSGRYERYGKRALQALELALAGEPFRLVVRDTGGEETTTAGPVEALVLEERVVGIIGPLFSGPATVAAAKAEEFGVPLLTLSHKEGLPGLGGYVFRTAVTVEAQATALAKTAFEHLGMRRFALLHPRGGYGEAFVHAFWDEVDRRGGSIRAIESYEPDQTTFIDPVKRMVGRYHVTARSDYRVAEAQLRAQKLPPHRLQAALEKIQKTLPPLVDFDAIVIPDSARNIGLVAPALAYEDIVLTRDPDAILRIKRATGHENATPVTLLGGSTWNHPTTVERCERYCDGAVFVDGLFLDSTEARVRDFVTLYSNATGAAPSLTEALAYDTAKLLVTILRAGVADREALRARLLSAHHAGVTGELSFNDRGEVQRELMVLTIQDGAIRRWQPVPAL
jgi:ABC-type branched-subunit amino acid transport system substrate-binding protein